MMPNHYLSYHTQNILSSQDRAPSVIWGEVVRFCQLLPLSPPLPNPRVPHLHQQLLLSSQPCQSFSRPSACPNRKHGHHPPLPLRVSPRLGGLIAIPLPSLFPPLLGPPRPDPDSLGTSPLLAVPSASPCCMGARRWAFLDSSHLCHP